MGLCPIPNLQGNKFGHLGVPFQIFVGIVASNKKYFSIPK